MNPTHYVEVADRLHSKFLSLCWLKPSDPLAADRIDLAMMAAVLSQLGWPRWSRERHVSLTWRPGCRQVAHGDARPFSLEGLKPNE